MGLRVRLVVCTAVAAAGIAAAATIFEFGPAVEPAPVRTGAPSSAAPPSPDPPPPQASAAAPPASYTADPLDVNPQVKEAAARFVEQVGTWRSPEPSEPVARVVTVGYPADLVDLAGPLVDTPARTATTTIVYPQYGGLTDTSASVMVLAHQELSTDSGDRGRDVLLDVRVARTADGTWQVTSTVDPPRPPIAPSRSGGPTELGRAVLDNSRIRIPEPGRVDIEDRRAGDPILSVLDDLARTYTLDVQVLVSGHPGTVFPTTRLSNHTVGRAVDGRAVDGRPVIGIPRDDPVLVEFMVAAGRAGATEVGAPIDIEGQGFFTDAVHQDHLHLGITPTKPAAAPAPRSGGPP